MSLIKLMRRMSPLVVLGAVMSSAYALPPQAVAPVKLPHGGRGVDGPFFPATKAAPVLPSTGATLRSRRSSVSMRGSAPIRCWATARP